MCELALTRETAASAKYVAVVEASLAKAAAETAVAAGERDAAVKRERSAASALAREKTTSSALRKRVAQLKSEASAHTVDASALSASSALVASLLAAVAAARAAEAATAADSAVLRDEAAGEVGEVRSRLTEACELLAGERHRCDLLSREIAVLRGLQQQGQVHHHQQRDQQQREQLQSELLEGDSRESDDSHRDTQDPRYRPLASVPPPAKQQRPGGRSEGSEGSPPSTCRQASSRVASAYESDGEERPAGSDCNTTTTNRNRLSQPPRAHAAEPLRQSVQPATRVHIQRSHVSQPDQLQPTFTVLPSAGAQQPPSPQQLYQQHVREQYLTADSARASTVNPAAPASAAVSSSTVAVSGRPPPAPRRPPAPPSSSSSTSSTAPRSAGHASSGGTADTTTLASSSSRGDVATSYGDVTAASTFRVGGAATAGGGVSPDFSHNARPTASAVNQTGANFLHLHHDANSSGTPLPPRNQTVSSSTRPPRDHTASSSTPSDEDESDIVATTTLSRDDYRPSSSSGDDRGRRDGEEEVRARELLRQWNAADPSLTSSLRRRSSTPSHTERAGKSVSRSAAMPSSPTKAHKTGVSAMTAATTPTRPTRSASASSSSRRPMGASGATADTVASAARLAAAVSFDLAPATRSPAAHVSHASRSSSAKKKPPGRAAFR